MPFTVQQAAYLMGMREITVRRLIEKGKLLVIAEGLKDAGMVHDSEMSRFRHPWEHVYRLDQRITAQQSLVELLKTKINESTGVDYRSDVAELQLDLEEMRVDYQSLKSEFEKMQVECARLREEYGAHETLLEKLRRRMSRKQGKPYPEADERG